ncbi:MAG TPA: imidazolonepropionase [Bryobacteraceae bacterium]|nr:imidazolonepropionase [Bryobacteraceae bacterium]
MILGCSELLTLAGPMRPRAGEELRELAIIRDGAMRIHDGVIEWVGARRDADTSGAEILDAGGRVVMPGFVDAHTHPVFAGNRADEFEMRAEGATYQEIAAAGGGIRSTVRKTRAAGEYELRAAASRYVEWFLRNGTTTIEAKSGYGLSLQDELKLLSVIQTLTPLRVVPTFLGAHEVPDEYRGRRGEYLDLVIHEMLPRAAEIARFCDVFCEPRVFPVEDARRVLQAARARGLGLRMHADQLESGGGAHLAAELGAATADHLEHTDASGIAALERAGVQPVLLPGAVYALGSRRYPDARAMIAARLAVVIATDFNPGSSPTPSMPMILSLAATQMKMTPAEAITASTINAAFSLGLGREIGSLEPGKRADFVIHDCADHRELAYFFGIEPAYEVYIAGERVYSKHSAA